jgi:hypothetical protein
MAVGFLGHLVRSRWSSSSFAGQRARMVLLHCSHNNYCLLCWGKEHTHCHFMERFMCVTLRVFSIGPIVVRERRTVFTHHALQSNYRYYYHRYIVEALPRVSLSWYFKGACRPNWKTSDATSSYNDNRPGPNYPMLQAVKGAPREEKVE